MDSTKRFKKLNSSTAMMAIVSFAPPPVIDKGLWFDVTKNGVVTITINGKPLPKDAKFSYTRNGNRHTVTYLGVEYSKTIDCSYNLFSEGAD